MDDLPPRAPGPLSALPDAPAGLSGTSNGAPTFPVPDPLGLLRDGEIEILGRLVDASNATFVCRVTERCPDPEPDLETTAVYKPIRGERPLDDFPMGTLANREVAAFLASEATGWAIVPPTVMRDGPLGQGALQLWIEADETIDPLALLRARDPALRRMALFDAAVNNADRKVGHLLAVGGGPGGIHVFGVDHGICFAVEPKLRTVLWVWRGEPLTPNEAGMLERLALALANDLGDALGELLSKREIAATRNRVDDLLTAGHFPHPLPGRPAIPWPPY
jgi:uncharacterized repeat protein (TIGR03843 family)